MAQEWGRSIQFEALGALLLLKYQYMERCISTRPLLLVAYCIQYTSVLTSAPLPVLQSNMADSIWRLQTHIKLIWRRDEVHGHRRDGSAPPARTGTLPHGTSLSPRVIAGVNRKSKPLERLFSISDHMSVRMLLYVPTARIVPQWTSSRDHDSHEPGFILLPRHYVSNMAPTIWHQ